jgi:lysophospholipase L1-like esterase
MIDAGKSLGLQVAVADLLPWNNGFPVAAPLITRLNRLIALSANLKDVQLLAFNEALADPGNPDLMRRPLTADGNHPSIAGYRRLGALVAERFG